MTKRDKLVQRFLAKPPHVLFEEVEALMRRNHCVEKSVRGSHHVFEAPDGRTVTVIKEGGRLVKRTYVRRIIEFLNLDR